jgi:hypothetical protein
VLAFLLTLGLAASWFGRALARAVADLRRYYREERERRG